MFDSLTSYYASEDHHYPLTNEVNFMSSVLSINETTIRSGAPPSSGLILGPQSGVNGISISLKEFLPMGVWVTVEISCLVYYQHPLLLIPTPVSVDFRSLYWILKMVISLVF